MARTYHGPSLAISMLTSVPSYDSAYTEHTREILVHKAAVVKTLFPQAISISSSMTQQMSKELSVTEAIRVNGIIGGSTHNNTCN